MRSRGVWLRAGSRGRRARGGSGSRRIERLEGAVVGRGVGSEGPAVSPACVDATCGRTRRAAPITARRSGSATIQIVGDKLARVRAGSGGLAASVGVDAG